MFDISFAKLAVIGIVALVVIGPQRLPLFAKTVGKMLGRAQLYLARIKAEFNREMATQEWQKIQLAQEKVQQSYSSFSQKLETHNSWLENNELDDININQLSKYKFSSSYYQNKLQTDHLFSYANEIRKRAKFQYYRSSKIPKRCPLPFIVYLNRKKNRYQIFGHHFNRRPFPKMRN